MQRETDTPPSFMQWEELTSLVGSIRTRSLVARPTTIEQCREALAYCRQHDMTICARGAGRGYGDLALNDGQALLDMSGMNRILEFDEETDADHRRGRHAAHRHLPGGPPPPAHAPRQPDRVALQRRRRDLRQRQRQGRLAPRQLRPPGRPPHPAARRRRDARRSTGRTSCSTPSSAASGCSASSWTRRCSSSRSRRPSSRSTASRRRTSTRCSRRWPRSRSRTTRPSCGWTPTPGAAGSGRSVIHAAKWIERDDTEAERREIPRGGLRAPRRAPPVRPRAAREVRPRPVAHAAGPAADDVRRSTGSTTPWAG